MPENFGQARMGELLTQLCAAFGKPFKANAAAMTQAYHRALSDWPIEAVEWAVWFACRDLDRFPRPATLRGLCAKSPHKKAPARDEMATTYDAWCVEPWADDGSAKPCPVCGSGYEWTRRGLLIVHSRELHREASVPYSNAGRPAWRELPALPVNPPHPQRNQAEHQPSTPSDPSRLADLIEPAAAAAHAILEPGDAWEEAVCEPT